MREMDIKQKHRLIYQYKMMVLNGINAMESVICISEVVDIFPGNLDSGL